MKLFLERLLRSAPSGVGTTPLRRQPFPPHKAQALLLAALSGLPLLCLKAQSSSEPVSEYAVKAAFLYNFAKFVEWPSQVFAGPDDRIVVCVYGKDPFDGLLEETLLGKMAGGRGFVIRRFKKLLYLEPCHILFVSSTSEKQLRELLQTVERMPILSVGERPGFVEIGGIVNFSLENNKVQFEINVDNARRASLRISSRLLALAKIVRDEGGAGRN